MSLRILLKTKFRWPFFIFFRECTELEAKVKACRALLGKSTGIRIGVTLKAFKEDQHSKFENELDRRIQNEQVLSIVSEYIKAKPGLMHG